MKSFLVRSALFVALLLGVQAAVALVYPAQIPAEILKFEALLNGGVDVLYFGDSTLWYPRGGETTPQILQTLLPDQTVGEVSHAAYGFEVYHAYAEALVRQIERDDSVQPPSWVVLPVNMRSFSPEWNLRPGYQFAEEQTLLRLGVPLARFVARPLDIFGGFDSDISQDEFLATTVYSNTTPVGRVDEFEVLTGVSALPDTNAAATDAVEGEQAGGEAFAYYASAPQESDIDAVLTYYYMNALDPSHRKLKAMVETVARLRSQNIHVLLYITPVNVDLGDAYIGPAFREQFARNVAVVSAALTSNFDKPPTLLDLSAELEAFNFEDTEHLTQRGKLYVAQQVAAAIAPTQEEIVPGNVEATPATPAPNDEAGGDADNADSTPMPPLLATQLARLTPTVEASADEASAGEPEKAEDTGSNATATPAPSGDDSEAAPATPVQNPLLATALARNTPTRAATPTP